MSGIFETWRNDFGPAAGIVWLPCAIEKNTRCMWSTDGASDSKPSTCGRQNPDPSSFFGIVMTQCGATGPILSAEDNPITNHTVTICLRPIKIQNHCKLNCSIIVKVISQVETPMKQTVT